MGAQGAGDLDTSFGDDGTVFTDFENISQAQARGLAIQPDDKIVVAGGGQEFALARYRLNGTLDTTFGGMGWVTTHFLGNPVPDAVTLQPYDGRVVAAGVAFSSSIGRETFTLARYHAITCGDVVVTRVGTAGNDTIMGTSGPDVIYGFGGNDLISGLGGDDILCGGKGNGTLRGSGGDDLLRGGSGTDSCDGGTADGGV